MMIRLLKALSVALGGLAITAAGLVYGAVFAGIPYQDPSAAMAKRFEFHDNVADAVIGLGGVVLVVGLVAAPFRFARRTTSR